MSAIGWQELVFIFVVALLFFGADKLPEVGRSLGKALSEFKKGMKVFTDDPEDKSDKDAKNG